MNIIKATQINSYFTVPKKVQWTGGAVVAISFIVACVFTYLYLTGIVHHLSPVVLFAPEGLSTTVGFGALVIGLIFSHRRQKIKNTRSTYQEISTKPQIILQEKKTLISTIYQHQLEDAAEKIFDNPLRSFLEIVVNGLDASLPPEKQTGKFGMGFLSILSFLHHKETNGASISIETTYQEEDKFITYSIQVDEQMQPNFKFASKIHTQTGTTITIEANQGKFSEETLKYLIASLYSLQFYEHGRIRIDTFSHTYFIGKGKNIFVKVLLLPNTLYVEDFGCGIPFSVAQKKLFVPSVSTKTANPKQITEPQLPEFVHFYGKKDQAPHFLLSVGGVIVIDLPIEKELTDDLLIKMPSDTKLTLARNAIEFSENDKSAEKHLKKMIDLTIQAVIDEKTTSEILVALYYGLMRWEKSAPSVQKVALSHYLKDQIYENVVKAEDVIAIPFGKRELFRTLLPKQPDMQLLPMHGELIGDDFSSLEKMLLENCKTNNSLIEGKQVIFTENVAEVTSEGLSFFLFAPTSFIDYAKERAEKEKIPEENILAFSLLHHYAEEGSFLCVHPKLRKENSLLQTKNGSEEHFLFISGITETYNKNIFTQKKCIDCFSSLFSTEMNTELQNLWNVLKTMIISKFQWEISPDRLSRNSFSALFLTDNFLIDLLSKKNFTLTQCFDIIVNNIINNSIIYNEGIEKYYIFNFQKYEEIKNKISEIYKKDYDIENIEKEVCSLFDNEEYFIEYSSTEVCKASIIFLINRFVSMNELNLARIVHNERTIWPFEKNELDLSVFFQTLFIFFNTYNITDKQIVYNFDTKFFSKSPLQKLDMFLPSENFLQTQIRSKLIDLSFLEKRVFDISNFSEHLKAEVRHFVSSILQYYKNYATFADHELKKEYGERLYELFPCTSDNLEDQLKKVSNFLEIYTLLDILKDTPFLFTKLLRLAAQEMQEILSLEKRRLLLRRKEKLQLPDFCGTNILSQLAYLNITLPKEILCCILTHVNTYKELALVELLLSHPEIHSKLQTLSQKNYPHIQEVVSVLIKHYIQQEISIEQLTSYLVYTPQKDFYEKGEFKQKKYTYINQTLLKYLKTGFDQEQEKHFLISSCFISDSLQNKLNLTKSFTTKQLFNALKEESFSSTVASGFLNDIVVKISSFSTQNEMNIINQCVEHGSERRCIDSTLLECLQNSLDAIKSINPEEENRETVTFSVEMIEDRLPQMMLEIRDQIGMDSLKTLLINFLVPSYSEKKGVVGQMGNGSFQMYKDAQTVTVKTRFVKDPSKTYFLCIDPIRKNREVVDLQLKCIEVENDEDFIGTEIRVLYRNIDKTKKEIEFEAISTLDFIRETISKTWVRLESNRPAVLFLKTQEGQKEKLNSIELNATTIQPPKGTSFTFVQTNSPLSSGLVLTNGYPFKSLAEFLKEHRLLSAELADEYAKGWCLNLPLGSFSPVQSRTKVKINKEQIEELKACIAQWLFERALMKEKIGQSISFFPHFESSSSSFKQICPDDGKRYTNQELQEKLASEGTSFLPTFFLHYHPYSSDSFLELINQGYKNLVPELSKLKNQLDQDLHSGEKKYKTVVENYEESCLEAFSTWKKSIESNLFIEMVIFPWFEKKVRAFSRDFPTLTELKNRDEKRRDPTEQKTYEGFQEKIENKASELIYGQQLISLAKGILSSYCGVKVDLYYDTTHSANAFYSHSSDTISVNLASKKKLSKILELGLRIARRESPEDDSFVTISLGHSGTLNHELEHKRRNSSHKAKDAHGDGKNAEGKRVNFEACAASYVRVKLRKEGYDRWSEEIQELLRQREINPSDLQKDIANLRELEHVHYDITMKQMLPLIKNPS